MSAEPWGLPLAAAVECVGRVALARWGDRRRLCLVRQEQGVVELRARDGTVDVVCWVDDPQLRADVPHGVLLPADRLRALAAAAGTDSLTLTAAADGGTRVAAGGFDFRLPGVPGSEWIDWPEAPPLTIRTVRGDDLVGALRRGGFCPGKQPPLASVLLRLHGRDREYAVEVRATDGHRLAAARIPEAETDPEDRERRQGPPRELLLPARTVDILVRSLLPGDVRIVAEEERVRFEQVALEVRSVQGVGVWPPTDGLLAAADFEGRIEVGVAELHDAVRLVALAGDGGHRGVTVRLTPAGLELACASAAHGTAVVRIAGTGKGSSTMIHDAEWLAEILAVLPPGRSVRFDAGGPERHSRLSIEPLGWCCLVNPLVPASQPEPEPAA